MAVNVPLTSGPDGQFPVPFLGETFLLTRDKTKLSFHDAAHNAKGLPCRLFLTNLRMVFLINPSDRHKSNCDSLEVPFRGLWDERFHQPIFGCNNLTSTIQYYDDQPFQGDLTIRIDFVHGGVNTFLPVFNNVLLATRVQMEAERRQQQPVASVAISSSTPSVNEFLPGNNIAFVDPQDPSTIYASQPVSEYEPRREAPAWSPSGAGLRKR